MDGRLEIPEAHQGDSARPEMDVPRWAYMPPQRPAAAFSRAPPATLGSIQSNPPGPGKDGAQDELTSKRMTDERKDLILATSEFFLYTAPDGAVKVRFLFKDKTAWLTQKALAELFGVEVPAITKHLKNIFDSGELGREATVSKMEIVQREGGRDVGRDVEFYNLDAIIAVGYRVNSYQATQFRIWATKTLREFIIKGWIASNPAATKVNTS